MANHRFQLVSKYSPSGDQPRAIEQLVQGFQNGACHQTLLGVTGSGKTFTTANVIQTLNRPTLLITHNKTLAAQLYSEFKSFFPHNAVEYFISYFDFYQPEAYIPRTDTYIEKDSSINDEIEKLRLSATSSLLTRRDVIVIASVSCIYGLGNKADYEEMILSLEIGLEKSRDHLLAELVTLQYNRNDIAFERGNFRVRGDTVEVFLAHVEQGLRIEFFGDEIDRLSLFEPLTGQTFDHLDNVIIFPAKHFVTPAEKIKQAILTIREELTDRIAEFEANGKLLEAQRIKNRTEYDLEMMLEMGFCSGIENYSRHLTGRPPNSRPNTLIEFFPKDFLLVIDESHATLPQIRGMYNGDRARKMTLVDHGFRLPSALDNRPLNFPEFQELQPLTLYLSATPSAWELEQSADHIVEQIVRPTGLVDPKVTLKPLKNQIDDLIHEIRSRVEVGERVLVTTLTKKTSEELTDYLLELDIRVSYLHSDIDAIERVEILRDLRLGKIDVLIGINLLREGLDLPEVSLVAILDADKEGFLRSTTSLVQTAGRAARHLHGEVILYADTETRSIKEFLAISQYRRERQLAYNELHQITPQSVQRVMEDSLGYRVGGKKSKATASLPDSNDITPELIADLEEEMLQAAQNLEFEKAALIRDQIQSLKAKASTETSSNPSKNKSKKSTKYK